MKHMLIWTLPAAFLLGIFQTAVLSHIQFLPALPDLILLLVIYTAFTYGTVQGIISGFFSGLMFDFLSISPFGLHAFIFTSIGFMYGLLYGKYNVQAALFPYFFGFLGTCFKAVIVMVLYFLFGSIIHIYDLNSSVFWFEAGINTILAPIFFFLCNLFHARAQKN